MACDDQQRPYEVINSPFTDTRAPWLAMMIPLPPKVYLSGGMAETWGHRTFRELGAASGVTKAWGDLNQALATTPKDASLRTFLRDARDYKGRLADQDRDGGVMRELRLARLPHYVWVVEAHDRTARDAGKPSVIAEILFDPNSSDHLNRRPRSEVSMPGLTVVTPPDAANPSPSDTRSVLGARSSPRPDAPRRFRRLLAGRGRTAERAVWVGSWVNEVIA